MKFRDAIARSNELHKHYLNDPRMYLSYDRFTLWQFDYMLPANVLASGPRTRALFLVEDDDAQIVANFRAREPSIVPQNGPAM